jgi:putative DNA primase/helicase
VPSWKQFTQRAPTDDEWLTHGWNSAEGLGVVAGRGLDCWDFDDATAFDRFIDVAIDADLLQLVNRIRAGYEDVTPSGGRRWLVKFPAAVTWKDETLAARPAPDRQSAKTLIELPTFAIVAPSNGRTHPSGRPYERWCGDFESIAEYSADERESLIALARSLDERPRREYAPPRATPAIAGNRPGDEFNRRMTWAEVLGPAGWVDVFERDGVTHWRRPGKDFGISATTNIGGSDLLYVFSSSTLFEPDRSYTKFAAYAVLNHGGNYTSAARTLARDSRFAVAAVTTAGPTAAFPLTESGDAEQFANLYGDRVRFDHRQGRWLIFDGAQHRWLPDADGELHRLALDSMRHRQRAGCDVDDADKRKKHVEWALHGEARYRIDNMLALAKNLPPIADKGENWDADPWLLGVANGVVNLQTGQIRDGRPEDRITMSTRVAYDSKAKSKLWETTIREIFERDDDLIAYMQRALGYSLTGSCREEVLFVSWGGGANGKSTIMRTIAWLLGDYADNLSFSALEHRERNGGSASPELAKLPGKRFVTASESSDTVRLNEARLKAMTGRDPVTARGLFENEFTFEPSFKLWLATNHRPVVQDDSDGFWRRIHLIPFLESFVGRENVLLKDTLCTEAEAPGILAWLVRGALAWQKAGRLDPPETVRAATAEYRRDSDPLTTFFEACCEITPKAREQAGPLYNAFKQWCASTELPKERRLSSVNFTRKVRSIFAVEEGRHTYFIGIRLRTQSF